MLHLAEHILIDDASRISEIRRTACKFAALEGLDETASGEVAIMATELATNGFKHAQRCEVAVRRLSPHDGSGVELLSIDRGPGIVSLDAAFTDGFSSVGTPGTGLGALRRMSDDFDVYTQLGKGTVILARKYAKRKPETRWTFGVVRVPYPGEFACGDNCTVREESGSLAILVADGLGHGLLAADASNAATQTFDRHHIYRPGEVLERVHGALRSTRGAAVATVALDSSGKRAAYAGIGNIAGMILGEKVQHMVSHNGTAGHTANRYQEFEYSLPDGGVVVMHSDGLVSNWNPAGYPGLLRRHPALIAAVLYRDANRGRDDVCVIAARFGGAT